jgi:hypothetical protein
MTFHRALRIGTRGSSLAVTQTGHVVDRLRALGVAVEVETITTRGDLSAPRPVGGLPGDGVFVRELEQALLDGRIDAAVHSLKDLPTAETPGLDLACVPLRAAPFDALVGRAGTTLASLPAGAVVGTSSVRRIVQLRRLRPDLVVRPVRGNVDTRLRNLDAGQYDGLILAAAGLERLGLGDRIVESLEPDAFWPARRSGHARGGPRRACVSCRTGRRLPGPDRWLGAVRRDGPPRARRLCARRDDDRCPADHGRSRGSVRRAGVRRRPCCGARSPRRRTTAAPGRRGHAREHAGHRRDDV